MIQESNTMGTPTTLLQGSQIFPTRFDDETHVLTHGHFPVMTLNNESNLQFAQTESLQPPPPPQLQQQQQQQPVSLSQQQQEDIVLFLQQQTAVFHANKNKKTESTNVRDQLCGNGMNSGFPFDYRSHHIAIESPKTEMDNNSDASTVEDNNATDVELIAPDEPYTYLQELNSDNLMQFSQQSVLQEMIQKGQVDTKPNLNILPTFEEHDIGGYKFNLNLRTQVKGKVNWVYSESLNKVYIRMNDILSIDAVHTPKVPMQKLRIRALMCFVKEVSEPVLRCQNHISKDPETKPSRHCILRCENPSAEYCGHAEGKSINDRYSVLIPLGMSALPKADNDIKHTIALKFTCQNSCIGRKETSLIFLLEGMNGEILSQRVLDVKVCSCPKRDKILDERNTQSLKRKRNGGYYERDVKIRKANSTASVDNIKQEEFCTDEEDHNASEVNTEKQYSIERAPSGAYRVVMEVYSKNVALQTIDYAYTKMAAKIVTEPKQKTRYYKNYRKLKSLYEKAVKL